MISSGNLKKDLQIIKNLKDAQDVQTAGLFIEEYMHIGKEVDYLLGGALAFLKDHPLFLEKMTFKKYINKKFDLNITKANNLIRLWGAFKPGGCGVSWEEVREIPISRLFYIVRLEDFIKNPHSMVNKARILTLPQLKRECPTPPRKDEQDGTATRRLYRGTSAQWEVIKNATTIANGGVPCKNREEFDMICFIAGEYLEYKIKGGIPDRVKNKFKIVA